MNETLVTEAMSGYELLDSGNGRKLERFGEVVLSRPDPQAIWLPLLDMSKWKSADAVFEQTGAKGQWKINTPVPENWTIPLDDLVFNLKLLPSKHVGVFPEQSGNWKWLRGIIEKHSHQGKKIKVLNLFAYTGGATLAAAKAGADVCHVDASEFAVDIAVKNTKSNGIEHAPIRFIVDDVRKFVEREIKRGKLYDIILMDPPVYGKGAKKEVWNLDEDLAPLIARLEKLLSKDPIAVLLNGYASGYSHSAYGHVLEIISRVRGGNILSGELAIKESHFDRLLPCGIFARWEK